MKMGKPLLAAFEELDKALPGYGKMKATLRGLMRAYDRVWKEKQSSMGLVFIESELFGKIYDLDSDDPKEVTGGRMEIGGKCDKCIWEYGELTVVDHKTTSMQIEGDADYWRAMDVSSQLIQYANLCLQNGVRVTRGVYDAVRKPAIKPKRLSAAETQEIVSTGRYYGHNLTKKTLKAFSDTIEVIGEYKRPNSKKGIKAGEPKYGGGEETLYMFELRVAHEAYENRHRYFVRHEIDLTEERILRHNRQLVPLALDMLMTKDAGVHHTNTSACLSYGTPCRYLAVCTGKDTFDSGRWMKGDRHKELSSDANERKDVLTYSRASTYNECKTKHHFAYYEGWEKVDEQEKEPLFYGTMWHLMMDEWWKHITPKANVTDGGMKAVLCKESEWKNSTGNEVRHA